MDLGLKDRVAIVVGSSRGLGRSIAMTLAQEGASVTICARTEVDLRRTEIELARLGSQHHVLAIPADLTVARDIRRVVRDTFNRFGQVGILVTHLWHGPTGRPSEFNDETILTAMEQNFLSAIRLTREVVPYMKQQRWGRIIHLMPCEDKRVSYGTALSASSRLALIGYSKMLSNELSPFNITVNNVLPGLIATDSMTSDLEHRAEEQGRTTNDLAKEIADGIPMRRMGKPEEVGALVAFLASDRAGYLTGTSVVMDGGLLQSVA